MSDPQTAIGYDVASDVIDNIRATTDDFEQRWSIVDAIIERLTDFQNDVTEDAGSDLFPAEGDSDD